MSKIVRVRYFNHNGEETEEVCYLVENSDTIIPKTTIENDLTFDGTTLSVSGIPVSLSGHLHNLSDIINISGAISSGILNSLSSLSTITNECDIEYALIQTLSNETKIVNISKLANAISIIDGGGVSYSGC